MHNPAGYRGNATQFKRHRLVIDDDFPLARKQHEDSFVGMAVFFISAPRRNRDQASIHDLQSFEGELAHLKIYAKLHILIDIVRLGTIRFRCRRVPGVSCGIWRIATGIANTGKQRLEIHEQKKLSVKVYSSSMDVSSYLGVPM